MSSIKENHRHYSNVASRLATMVAFLAFFSTCSIGCQQTLSIKVERLLVKSSTESLHSQRLAFLADKALPAVREVQVRLFTTTELYKTIKKKIEGEALRSKSTEELNAEFDTLKPAEDIINVATQMWQRGDKLAEEIKTYLQFVNANSTPENPNSRNDPGVTNDRITEARVYVSEVTQLLNGFLAKRKDAIDRIRKYADRNRGSDVTAITDLLALVDAATEFAKSSNVAAQDVNVGFGGFVSQEVFEISASNAHLQGAVVIEEPFNRTYANVSGDSTIIIVQESPVQSRFYSVEMDSETLTRNIIFITDKALQAAIKYAIPVP